MKMAKKKQMTVLKERVRVQQIEKEDFISLTDIAKFGKTAKQWREANPKEKGNIRDFANVSQLVCLSNLENLNAHFI
jgi:hypothetical protein